MCPEMTSVEFHPSEEVLNNVRKVSQEKAQTWEKYNYIKNELCGIGLRGTIHAIRRGWKEDVEEKALMFLIYLIHAEEERLEKLTNSIREPNTEAVKNITANFKKCAAKKRFVNYEIQFKKVKSVYGKYLVTFEARMKNDAHIKFSLYSNETLVKQNSPEWVKKDRSKAICSVDNIQQIEQFAKKYISL